jgi:hypothetical protein
MSAEKHTTIRLTAEERARFERIAEAVGATGYQGGIRAAGLLAARALGISPAAVGTVTMTSVETGEEVVSHRGRVGGRGRAGRHPGDRDSCALCAAEKKWTAEKKGAVKE